MDMVLVEGQRIMLGKRKKWATTLSIPGLTEKKAAELEYAVDAVKSVRPIGPTSIISTAEEWMTSLNCVVAVIDFTTSLITDSNLTPLN